MSFLSLFDCQAIQNGVRTMSSFYLLRAKVKSGIFFLTCDFAVIGIILGAVAEAIFKRISALGCLFIVDV